MKIIIISDIHANLSALQAVMKDCDNKYGLDTKIIHLGDCIDYGMRPNETIDELNKYTFRTLVNLKGNHERAILGFEADRFSSARGKEANNYTKKILSSEAIDFISNMSDDYCEINLCNRIILCVHGDLTDKYWGKMDENEIIKSCYQDYDMVISGHTHISSFKTVLNKDKTHKTLFINPGSVGQPRNLNNNAQYCVVDLSTSSVEFNCVEYDIKLEQSLYTGEIDEYYKNRLSKGI